MWRAAWRGPAAPAAAPCACGVGAAAGTNSRGAQNMSAAYLQRYLDAVENLPFDIQRDVTAVRELDAQDAGPVFLRRGRRASCKSKYQRQRRAWCSE